jgi:hypothetical protein
MASIQVDILCHILSVCAGDPHIDRSASVSERAPEAGDNLPKQTFLAEHLRKAGSRVQLLPMLSRALASCDIKGTLVDSVVPGPSQVAWTDDPTAQSTSVPIIVEGLDDGERPVGRDGPCVVGLANLTGIG